MENMFEKTRISKRNTELLVRENLSPEEIVEFLEKGAVYRSFKDVLQKVYQGDDLRRELTDRLAEITKGNRDSISRNIRNWLNGEEAKRPRRKQLFQICFALALSEEDANLLIASVSETGIHYRNPEELIYAFCLKNGKSWEAAEKLLADAEQEIIKIRKGKGKKIRKNDGVQKIIYTRQIHENFEEQVKTEKNLLDFLASNSENLGELHETAYRDFCEMMKHLQDPEDGYQRLNVHKVMKDYLQMYVPEKQGKGGRSKGDYSYLQRVIQKNWPSEDILAKMSSRDIDVSRKVMILLNLLTAEFETRGIDSDQPEDYDFYLEFLEESETAQERMEARVIQLNLFLDKYGMNYLDPGNAFDCLVLYALRASIDGDRDTMSERMKDALRMLYPKEEA